MPLAIQRVDAVVRLDVNLRAGESLPRHGDGVSRGDPRASRSRSRRRRRSASMRHTRTHSSPADSGCLRSPVGRPHRVPRRSPRVSESLLRSPRPASQASTEGGPTVTRTGGSQPPPRSVAVLSSSRRSQPVPAPHSDKKRHLLWLRCRGIAALDFWSVPHPSLPAARFREAASLRANVVGLPVHQELSESDLDRILTTVLGRPRSQ